MKKCKCGFEYKTKDSLEIIRIAKENKLKYYCPDCKSYKYAEKYNSDKNEYNINKER